MNEQAKPRGDILIVDDMAANLKVLSTMLTDNGYNVRPAINGSLALKAASSITPDLILLDIMMPGMDGYEVCQKLKENETTHDIPVIFISALDEVVNKVRGFEMGAVDYITKPFQMAEVVARVNTHLTIYKQRKEIEGLNAFKDLFIRTVSHDLGSPISNILGYTEMLIQDGDRLDPDYAKQMLSRISTSAERMQRLVNSMLDLTRIEGVTLRPSPLLLRDVLDGVFMEFQFPAQEKGITVRPPQNPIQAQINADPDLIGEVFQNLLSNAVKYTPANGEITINVETDSSHVFVHIDDTGYGIPEEDIPYLFERFYRVGRTEHIAQQGSGLGLSIAKLILDRHEGEIRVKSQIGQGSRFTVSLPIYDPQTAAVNL